MKPSVSVITPAYNVEAYLGAAIDSVLAQTRQDFELLIVDDCSTDRTVEIAERYTDSRIRVFRNERNGGPSQSRNAAIDQARGEWVAILDSDDWWEAHRLERLLSLATAHQADIVCDDLLFIRDGERKPSATFLRMRARQLGTIDKPFEVSALKMAVDDYGFLKPMFRKSFLDTHGIRYNPAFRAGEDFEFLLRCLLSSARMVVSPEAMYYYRAREGSLVADPIRCLSNILEMTNELIRTTDTRAHGAVVEALENYRERKRGELADARFRVPLHQGDWRQCLTLAVRNPSKLGRYLAMMVGHVLFALVAPRRR